MQQQPPSPRRKLRRLVIQGLYAWSFCPESQDTLLEALTNHSEYREYLTDAYFGFLFNGVIREVERLDAYLAAYATRPLNQLGPVEHAILRLACFELLASPEVPQKVVINEAIELAKAFGATDSFKFINGVLHRLMQQPLGQAAPAPPVDDASASR